MARKSCLFQIFGSWECIVCQDAKPALWRPPLLIIHHLTQHPLLPQRSAGLGEAGTGWKQHRCVKESLYLGNKHRRCCQAPRGPQRSRQLGVSSFENASLPIKKRKNVTRDCTWASASPTGVTSVIRLRSDYLNRMRVKQATLRKKFGRTTY